MPDLDPCAAGTRRISAVQDGVATLAPVFAVGRIRPITPPRHALETRVRFGSRRRVTGGRLDGAAVGGQCAADLPSGGQIAEEDRKNRQDSAGAASGSISKVFGAIDR
jgi:hypothetical protein